MGNLSRDVPKIIKQVHRKSKFSSTSIKWIHIIFPYY